MAWLDYRGTVGGRQGLILIPTLRLSDFTGRMLPPTHHHNKSHFSPEQLSGDGNADIGL